MHAVSATRLLALLVVGCAPHYHKAEPYRYDHLRAMSVEANAEARCIEAVGTSSVPERTFTTDGCTLWPDGSFTGTPWQKCCIAHDVAYWCGGTSDERATADEELRRCVSEEYGAVMGVVMWLGTRAAGHPLVPFYWRWGYGHDYPLGF